MLKASPVPPAGSGLTTLAPRQGDTRELSLRKINAILYDAAAQPVTFNVGVSAPGSAQGGFTGISGTRIVLAQAGTLQSISIFLSQAGVNILLGLYSDASGNPGTLLASSAVALSIVGDNKLAIASGPRLSPGNYWLVMQSQVPVQGYNDPGGASAWNGAVSWTASLPATFPLNNSGAYTFSFYATFLA